MGPLAAIAVGEGLWVLAAATWAFLALGGFMRAGVRDSAFQWGILLLLICVVGAVVPLE